MRNPVEEFERKYRESGDPWDYETSEYETTKYARTVAALPDGTFASALELGASIGVLSERLAARCKRLVTLEPAPTAVERARQRLAGHPNVDVRLGIAPEDLPDEKFDLIVCSEVLYYFSLDELAPAFDAIERRLLPGAVLLAVHWRGLGTHQLTGDQVHDVLRSRPTLLAGHSETHERYLLDVFRAVT